MTFALINIKKWEALRMCKNTKVNIVYRFNGCINEYCTKADKFVIDFPRNADFADKALIVMAAITIDYDNFEYTFCNLP